MNKQNFNLENVRKMWEEVWDKIVEDNQDESLAFDIFYDNLTKVYGDDKTTVFVRLVWWCDNSDDVYDELLDLGCNYKVKQYATFRDDIEECTVIVALHNGEK